MVRSTGEVERNGTRKDFEDPCGVRDGLRRLSQHTELGVPIAAMVSKPPLQEGA
jgi:hypothetical protein